MEQENTKIMDAAGEILAELGRTDEAKQMLLRSIQLAPDGPADKYLNLAQLMDGQAALAMYRRGIDILNSRRQLCGETSSEAASLCKSLSTALCACAEIFMTDLCDEPNAEAQCEDFLQRAVAVTTPENPNPEPLQAIANLRLRQNRRDDAATYMQRTMQVLRSYGEEDEKPNGAFRTVTAKLLIELKQYDDAVEVLDALLEEDEDDPQLHYLLGTCYFDAPDHDYPLALEAFEKSLSLLVKMPRVDDRILQDVEERIQATKDAIQNEPPPTSEPQPMEDGDDDDEDQDDEDEAMQ